MCDLNGHSCCMLAGQCQPVLEPTARCRRVGGKCAWLMPTSATKAFCATSHDVPSRGYSLVIHICPSRSWDDDCSLGLLKADVYHFFKSTFCVFHVSFTHVKDRFSASLGCLIPWLVQLCVGGGDFWAFVWQHHGTCACNMSRFLKYSGPDHQDTWLTFG